MAKEEQKKLSYEELEKKLAACELVLKQEEAKLINQSRMMSEKIQSLYDALNYRRLDYLFKVVEHADKFNSEFVVTCVEEIEQTLTVPEPNEQSEE